MAEEILVAAANANVRALAGRTALPAVPLVEILVAGVPTPKPTWDAVGVRCPWDR
jgi:hypothetical protein